MIHPLRTVLVTGATGFPGGRLAPALAARGIRVRAHGRDQARMPRLSSAVATSRMRRGDRVFLFGLAAGLSIGGAAITY